MFTQATAIAEEKKINTVAADVGVCRHKHDILTRTDTLTLTHTHTHTHTGTGEEIQTDTQTEGELFQKINEKERSLDDVLR